MPPQAPLHYARDMGNSAQVRRDAGVDGRGQLLEPSRLPHREGAISLAEQYRQYSRIFIVGEEIGIAML